MYSNLNELGQSRLQRPEENSVTDVPNKVKLPDTTPELTMQMSYVFFHVHFSSRSSPIYLNSLPALMAYSPYFPCTSPLILDHAQR